MQQTTERIRREAIEQKRFDDFEYQRRFIDELTEASEKLAMVMHNSFEFEMRADGELCAEDGSNLGKVLRDSLAVAEQIAMTNPNFMTEVIRRRIELQEYDEQRRLALGSDDDPDVLVVLSPIPDAAVAGIDLGAYDPERMKTLARIYRRTETGIVSTSISLDRSDRAGLQAIARQFGQVIHDDDGSEDILGMRLWGYASVLDDPVKTVRRRYDEQLERQHGGEWYGGRQDGEVIDALTFIRQQTDIIDGHMQRMRQIDQSPGGGRADERKKQRYDFAAALDRRRHGGTTLGDGGDLGGSGDAARAEGIEYKSDCPDGQAAQAAVQAVNELYGRKESKIVDMTCPYCGLATTGDPCAFRLVCGRCSAEVRGGKIWSTGIGRAAALAREAEQQREERKLEQKQKVSVKHQMAKAAIPTVFMSEYLYYERVQVMGLGGTVEEIREISRGEWSARREEYRLAA